MVSISSRKPSPPRNKRRKVIVGAATAVLALTASAILLAGPSADDDHALRRQLAAKPKQCEIRPAEAPPKSHALTTAFVASYPGSGAKMTWKLIEALTGIVTGDEHRLNGHPWERTVTVKTHFPHEHGNPEIGSTSNAEFPRAILLLRHPKEAIPSFFNFLYEWQNNLPGHSTRAPVDYWVNWRDNNFEEQMAVWAQHTDYWLSRYDPNNMLILGFESMVDEKGGPKSAMGLANFLSYSEGVDNVETKPGKIACIWENIVRYKKSPSDTSGPRLDSLIGAPNNNNKKKGKANEDSLQRSGDEDRPYTVEQLTEMIRLIHTLQKKHKDNKQLMPWLRSYKTIAEGDIRRIKNTEQCGNPEGCPEDQPVATTVANKEADHSSVATAPVVPVPPVAAEPTNIVLQQMYATVPEAAAVAPVQAYPAPDAAATAATAAAVTAALAPVQQLYAAPQEAVAPMPEEVVAPVAGPESAAAVAPPVPQLYAAPQDNTPVPEELAPAQDAAVAAAPVPQMYAAPQDVAPEQQQQAPKIPVEPAQHAAPESAQAVGAAEKQPAPLVEANQQAYAVSQTVAPLSAEVPPVQYATPEATQAVVAAAVAPVQANSAPEAASTAPVPQVPQEVAPMPEEVASAASEATASVAAPVAPIPPDQQAAVAAEQQTPVLTAPVPQQMTGSTEVQQPVAQYAQTA